MDFWKITPADGQAGADYGEENCDQRERNITMDEKMIQRINELYRKSKAEGLTEAEAKEQKILRQQYIEAVRRNLRGQLDNIDVKEKDGSIVNLGEKYGSKKGC